MCTEDCVFRPQLIDGARRESARLIYSKHFRDKLSAKTHGQLIKKWSSAACFSLLKDKCQCGTFSAVSSPECTDMCTDWAHIFKNKKCGW